MVTRVVEKQAKTTKVKNNFINGKKKFKRILSCLFDGRRNVQICLKTSSLLSVLLRTRSAHCLRPNIVELVPSGFFCPQLWFLRGSEHIFPGKNTSIFNVDWQLVTEKEISSNINIAK